MRTNKLNTNRGRFVVDGGRCAFAYQIEERCSRVAVRSNTNTGENLWLSLLINLAEIKSMKVIEPMNYHLTAA